MKFRLSVQPRRHRQELKSVAPALLSDPAFSPDPHANPYFVSAEPAWASSPPVGHPTLKKRQFSQSITGADFDLQLIQPPNSPVAPSATANPRFFAAQPAAPPAAPPATSPRPRSQPPAEKKGRMPLFSRRKSALPVPSASQKPVVDVTQPPDPRPAPGPRYSSEPVTNVNSRPNPPRRAATTGASTPRSTAASTAPSQGPSARNQDLDRIDELDETNPWGISLHHGGPYEAAVQAIRRADNRMPSGFSVNLNDYPRQAMHAHGNLYVPPRVPPGVSLNLSPGQILPRNFHLQNDYHRAPDAPAAPHPQMMMPPGFSPGPPRARHLSQPVPAVSPLPNPHPILRMEPRYSPGPPSSRHLSQPILPPLPNPHPIVQMDPRFSLGPPNARHLSQPLPTVSPLPNSQLIINMEPRDPPPNQEPETEEPVEELSFNIGMAMLQPEASESSNPSVFLHPETSDEGEFDPYDPVHLKNGHSRTPSPLVNSTPQRSRGPSPDPKTQRLTPEPTTLGKSADKADHPQISSPPEEMPDPPPYTSPLSTPENYQHLQPLFPVPTHDRSRAPSRNPSPGPPSSSSSTANSGTRPIHENDYSRQGMPVSTDKPTPTQSTPPMPPNQSAATHNIQFVTPAPVARISREYLPNPGPPSVQDRVDGRSTHHSISTFSSNQSRNGGQPPPHRRVPRHLVMPAPLNNNPNISMPQPPSRMQQPPSASPFAPVKVQVQVRSQPMSYSQPPPLRGPIQPSVGSPVRAQEIQMAAARKLRKRVSTITPPSVGNIPSVPIVTTVSFAAPVIGFNNSPAIEKAIGRSKTEKIPKRVLSKRRADL